MDSSEPSKVTFFNFSHSLNALTPMLLTEEGMLMFSNDLHLQNVRSGIEFTQFEIVAVFNFSQLEKTPFPKTVFDSEKETSSRVEKLLKQFDAIEFTFPNDYFVYIFIFQLFNAIYII